MLVVTRYEGDRIQVGPEITIKIISVSKAGKVRVGVEAPDHLSIVRHDAKKQEPRDRS